MTLNKKNQLGFFCKSSVMSYNQAKKWCYQYNCRNSYIVIIIHPFIFAVVETKTSQNNFLPLLKYLKLLRKTRFCSWRLLLTILNSWAAWFWMTFVSKCVIWAGVGGKEEGKNILKILHHNQIFDSDII
jgi:hypothetical protein